MLATSSMHLRRPNLEIRGVEIRRAVKGGARNLCAFSDILRLGSPTKGPDARRNAFVSSALTAYAGRGDVTSGSDESQARFRGIICAAPHRDAVPSRAFHNGAVKENFFAGERIPPR
ncbi:hypothetical protein MRX96_003881 [Rhipicephalus microplus]